jgi:DNA-directed RNA polymerase specialized sigma24 family protein
MADPTAFADPTTFPDQAMAHTSSLYSVALRRTRNPDDAEDYVQVAGGGGARAGPAT